MPKISNIRHSTNRIDSTLPNHAQHKMRGRAVTPLSSSKADLKKLPKPVLPHAKSCCLNKLFLCIKSYFKKLVEKIRSCAGKRFAHKHENHSLKSKSEELSTRSEGSDTDSDDWSSLSELKDIEISLNKIGRGSLPLKNREIASVAPIKSAQLFLEWQAETKPKIPHRARELAKEIQKQLDPTTKVFPVKGQPNLGNSCYMNATLQLLETLYGRHDTRCFSLLEQDLTLKEKETLVQLEDRIMKRWAPIVDMNPERLEERLLFKWVYLLLLQAKKTGDEQLIHRAVQLHHDTCFTINQYEEFQSGHYGQKDASEYLIQWHDMLGLNSIRTSSILTGQHEGVELKKNPSIETHAFISVALSSKPNSSMSMLTLLNEYFGSEKVEQVAFDLPDGKSVKLEVSDRKLSLHGEAPEFLAIHLKRFQTQQITIPIPRKTIKKSKKTRSNDQDPKATAAPAQQFKSMLVERKLDGPVPIGTDDGTIDLSDKFDSPMCGRSAIYVPTGIVVHAGTTTKSGHYTAYTCRDIKTIRTNKDGTRTVEKKRKWYEISDSYSKEITADKVPFEKAYIITFRLKHTLDIPRNQHNDCSTN